MSQGDAYHSNFATAAGGIIFATDLATVKMSCTANHNETQIMAADWSADQAACDAWQDNSVGPLGYGPQLALPPSSLSLELPAWGSYASNGSNQLQFVIQVQDAVGTQVTPGKLHISASCLCLCLLPSPPSTQSQGLGLCIWSNP